ncbi:MAG: hypothetical protein HKN35_12605 [Woeseia sp.]|nr:ABC transporter permease [Woeseia sp.]MBT8095822.1 ABC transporter permease [Woeseia sp.]NNE61728.1 hypothetical protein [Woeseia sp.]NNL55076.1 hypothetical protein [Woeseia sp.]
MIQRQWALLQRELWEHRAIYVAPLALGLVSVLLALTGQVAVSAFDQAVDIAILGASNVGERERAAAISILTMAIATLFAFAMAILATFYLLDALYTERRDKSILFWRSLPVSDAETVVSKLLTAILTIPLFSLATAIVTVLLVLGISSLWVDGRGGDALSLIWGAAPLMKNGFALLILFLALPLWFMPLVGWFMFVSAWTRRSPFLVALLPLAVVPMLERILVGSTLFRDAIFVRSAQIPLFDRPDAAGMVFEDSSDMRLAADAKTSLLGYLDVAGFVTNPGLWMGLIVGGLFIAGAVYVRRYRDDS